MQVCRSLLTVKSLNLSINGLTRNARLQSIKDKQHWLAKELLTDRKGDRP